MITIDRKSLTDAVAFASRALPRAAAHPTLNGMRLSTTDGAVTVSAFDYDVYAEATVAQVTTAGLDLLVPGRAFASYLSGMRGARVDVTANDSSVTVTCGSAVITLPRLSIDDYPAAPAIPPSVGTIDGAELAQAVSSVAPAIDPANTTTALRGFVLDSRDGLVLAGGSRFAFAVRQLSSWTGEPFGFALPPLALADAGKSLDGTDVVLGRDDGRVSLSTDDRCLTVRTLDGQPPTFQRLFDAHSPTTTVTVDKAELAERLKFIALGDTRKDSRGHLVLTVTADSLRIALHGADLTATEEVEAKVDGDGMDVGFKAEYLLDGINGASAATVTLGFVTPTKPCLVTAESDPGFRYLCMPFRLSR